MLPSCYVILASWFLCLGFIHATTLSPVRHSDERHKIYLPAAVVLWKAALTRSLVLLFFFSPFFFLALTHSLLYGKLIKSYPFVIVYRHCFYLPVLWFYCKPCKPSTVLCFCFAWCALRNDTMMNTPYNLIIDSPHFTYSTFASNI